MSGDINFFRKSFFGGFNRKDVVDYIEKLAQERNELDEWKENAQKEADSLRDANRALRQEAEEMKEQSDLVAKALGEDNGKLRQEIELAMDKARKTAATHENEVATLKQEAEEAKRLMWESNNRQTAMFEAAGRTLEEFEKALGEYSADLKEKMDKAMTELRSAGDSVDKLPSTLSQVIDRMNELRAAFNMDSTNLPIAKDD